MEVASDHRVPCDRVSVRRFVEQLLCNLDEAVSHAFRNLGVGGYLGIGVDFSGMDSSEKRWVCEKEGDLTAEIDRFGGFCELRGTHEEEHNSMRFDSQLKRSAAFKFLKRAQSDLKRGKLAYKLFVICLQHK